MGADARVVLVTGAAGNLGRAVAHRFARDGDRLVLLDRSAPELERAFAALGDAAWCAALDLRDAAQVDAVVAAACERFGRIDVLCNLAGGYRAGTPVHATDDATWDWVFELNVGTLRHAVRAVVPQMLRQRCGAIVNVAAAAAQHGQAGAGAYAAAKAAVIRLTESMAAELRGHGINVNCVLPSILDTPENRAAMPEADPAHWVAPQDLAGVVAFLASADARAVHGAALPVVGLV